MIDILVIEDNKEIGILLCDFLMADGYSVHLSETGQKGADFFEKEGARLVLLDIMLPDVDGFAVCKRIRQNNNTPIIIVSAKGEKEDKLNGLMIGADDYIEKPYDIDILLAKINGIFKRRYDNDIISCGNIKIDTTRRTVYVNDIEIKMTVKEYELLAYLMKNMGKTLSKEAIFNEIWGYESFSELQTLTVHIKWLREKIPNHIITVWGVGYRFEE